MLLLLLTAQKQYSKKECLLGTGHKAGRVLTILDISLLEEWEDDRWEEDLQNRCVARQCGTCARVVSAKTQVRVCFLCAWVSEHASK